MDKTDVASWSSTESATLVVHSRGFANVDGGVLEGQSLSARIAEAARRCDNVEDVKQLARQLDGAWAFVIEHKDGRVFAATDRIRSIPIFYSHAKGELRLAAHPQNLCNDGVTDSIGALEFVLTGYVTGNSTLFHSIKQIPAGTLLDFTGSLKPNVHTYYQYLPHSPSKTPESTLADELRDVLFHSFSTCIDGISGRPILVPLSGGLDSRLVLAMLRHFGVEDVVCYSYGNRESEESIISRQVADALDYRWEFVPYSSQLWKSLMNRAGFWPTACRASYNCAVSHVQDYPAILHLRDAGICTSESVFFPGHSGDMIAGSHIPRDHSAIASGDLSVVDALLRAHYCALWPITPENFASDPLATMRTRIANELPSGADPVGLVETWNLANRQARYIVHSVRMYEAIGSKWRTMWFGELMDFFASVPFHLRFKRRLYIETLQSLVLPGIEPRLKEIPIAGESNSGPSRKRLTSQVKMLMAPRVRRTRRWCERAGIYFRSRPVSPNHPYSALVSGLGISPDTCRSVDDFLNTAKINRDVMPPEVQWLLENCRRFPFSRLDPIGLFGLCILSRIYTS